MNPDTRRLVRMELDPKEIKKITEKFELLMDAGEAEGRRNWMREHWKTVEADIEKEQALLGKGVPGPRVLVGKGDARQGDPGRDRALHVGSRRARRQRR